MTATTRVKLVIMMFLEFLVWGAWYGAIAVYMSANGMKDLTHWPFTANAIAAIVSPFFVGLIADRFFATQKVLGTLHLIGAVFMFLAPSFSDSPIVFILLLIAYNICYMPTLSLANTLAFGQMTNQEKEFPAIRVFGTIGWIAAGLIISYGLSGFVADVKPESTALPLYLSAGFSVLLGFYSFTLPNTPPPAAGKAVSARAIIGVDAFKQLGSPSFYVFLLSSFLICIPLAVYYNYTQLYLASAGFEKIAATQVLGQVSEIGFMVIMPLLFRRLGVKWMLGIGMAAWVLRYALFAAGAPDAVTWMILTGIALHGICYDFFFVTGQIYMDKAASPEIRGQAQGLIIFTTYGVGMFVGAQAAGYLYNSFLQQNESLSLEQWQRFWWIPAAFAMGILLLFLAIFREKRSPS
ncbi:MAG: MFS transporter [Chitinophagaceae bacterium]|nr:MFS transporter [Chitinophagaceae bacterium]MCW5929463.1 MFS transporter [Chitinophagaceae bacterium]